MKYYKQYSNFTQICHSTYYFLSLFIKNTIKYNKSYQLSKIIIVMNIITYEIVKNV